MAPDAASRSSPTSWPSGTSTRPTPTRTSKIRNAVEPGLATTGGPLILASSPLARRGALWDDSNATTAQVAIRSFSSLTARPGPYILHCRSAVDRALEKDRARATAEYLAQFRTDIEGFVALEAVEACTGDYREMLPAANNFYRAFTDPAAAPMTASRWQSRTSPRTRLSSMPFARPARRSRRCGGR